MSKRAKLLQTRGKLTKDTASDMLMLVGYEFVSQSPSQAELAIAYDFAAREHLRASDNRIGRAEKPEFVRPISLF